MNTSTLGATPNPQSQVVVLDMFARLSIALADEVADRDALRRMAKLLEQARLLFLQATPTPAGELREG